MPAFDIASLGKVAVHVRLQCATILDYGYMIAMIAAFVNAI